MFIGGEIHRWHRSRDHKFGAGALRRHCCRRGKPHRGPRHSAAGESKRSGGTHVAAVVSLHSGRIRFSQGQPRLAMGTRAEVRDRRTGAQTRRGESKPPGRLGQILALLRRGETALRRSCLGKRPRRCPSYRRSKRRRSSCGTCAPCGTAARQGSKENSLLRSRTCCSLCPLRSTKKPAS